MKAKFVIEFLNEVIRAEDEWANREIDKYQGIEVEEPVEEKPTKTGSIADGITREQFQEIQQKAQIASQISSIEEHLLEKGSQEQILDWQDYLRSIISTYDKEVRSWLELDMADLEAAILFGRKLVNNTRP